MSLHYIIKNIKGFYRNIEKRILSNFWPLSIFIAGIILCQLAYVYFSWNRAPSVKVLKGVYLKTKNEDLFKDTTMGQTPKIEENKTIVASKNGKKYYYIWCKGVKRIKEENKIFFSSTEEARGRGLEPAKSCPGL